MTPLQRHQAYARPTTDKREFPDRGFVSQGGIRNYHPAPSQTLDNVPVNWRSKPSQPLAQLAYITDKEKEFLKIFNLHDKDPEGHERLLNEQNVGPHGILSLDDSGGGVGDGPGPGGTGGGAEDDAAADAAAAAANAAAQGIAQGTPAGDDPTADDSMDVAGQFGPPAGPGLGSTEEGIRDAIAEAAVSQGIADPTAPLSTLSSFLRGFPATLARAIPGVSVDVARTGPITSSFSPVGALVGTAGMFAGIPGLETALNQTVGPIGPSFALGTTPAAAAPTTTNNAPQGIASAPVGALSSLVSAISDRGQSPTPTGSLVGTAPSIFGPAPTSPTGQYSYSPATGYSYSLPGYT